MVGGAASFTAKDRLKLLADLEPLRKGDEVVDGEPSRWNSAADKRWIPVRPEKVCEVAYDQMEGNTVHGQRFRHAVKFIRWRPDRDPESCTFDQLDVPLNYDLYDVLESLNGNARRRTRCRRRQGPADQPRQGVLPEAGSDGTKRKLVEYYLAVASGPMLTALRDRPTHLQRFPDGIDGEEIYQKRVPQKHPDYLETCRVTFPSGRTADALKVTHPSAIAWAAQMGTITLHPWQVRCPDTEHPDELRIDLDPQPGTGFKEASAIAVDVLKPLLDELGLVGYPKTSGGRGVHVFLRIKPDWDFIAVRRAGIALAREVERRAPDAVTTSWWKEERGQAALHRLQPERPRPHLRVGVLGAQDPDRDGVDAADVGRAARRRPRRLHHRHGAGSRCGPR